MWCSPECGRRYPPPRNSGGARFSGTSGRTPRRDGRRAVRGIGERAGGRGGGSRATGSRSRTTCACCARATRRDTEETRRHARLARPERSGSRRRRLPGGRRRGTTMLRRIASIAADVHTNAGVDAGKTAAPFPRMRRPTTPNDSSGRERAIVFSNSFFVEAWGARGVSVSPPLASPGRCIERCRGSTTRARQTARGRSCTSLNLNPGGRLRECPRDQAREGGRRARYRTSTNGTRERREQLWAKYRFGRQLLCQSPGRESAAAGGGSVSRAAFGSVDATTRDDGAETDGMIRDVRAGVRRCARTRT